MKYTFHTIFLFPLEAPASYISFKTACFDVYLDSISTTTAFFPIHIYTPFFVEQQKLPYFNRLLIFFISFIVFRDHFNIIKNHCCPQDL